MNTPLRLTALAALIVLTRGAAALGVFATAIMMVGCTVPCTAQQGPEATADFSALRLQGALRCDTAAKCEMTFNQAEGVLVVEREGFVNRLTYDVQYAGTHTQAQDVTSSIDFGGTGACLTTNNYRFETWTVPTVTMTLRSGTRNGQPLVLDETTYVGGKPSAWYAKLEVKTHYVDRTNQDDYVGVLVTGQPVQVADSLEMPITKIGGRFRIGPI